MKISWKLDDEVMEDTPRELFDFMGEIELQSNHERIIDYSINIEEIFYVFINACTELKIKNKYVAEMVYEKYDFVFEVRNNALFITYGDQQIIVSSKEEFCSTVIVSLKQFLFYLKQFFTEEQLMKDRIFSVVLSYMNSSHTIEKK